MLPLIGIADDGHRAAAQLAVIRSGEQPTQHRIGLESHRKLQSMSVCAGNRLARSRLAILAQAISSTIAAIPISKNNGC